MEEAEYRQRRQQSAPVTQLRLGVGRAFGQERSERWHDIA
jgi:hypothetical protein